MEAIIEVDKVLELGIERREGHDEEWSMRETGTVAALRDEGERGGGSSGSAEWQQRESCRVVERLYIAVGAGLIRGR